MRKEDIKERYGLESTSDYYVTSPAPCPYLHGRSERKIFSFLTDEQASQTNSSLTQRGFRRSQNIIYVPACENCNACVAVRVKVNDFYLTKSRRRIINRNQDLIRRIRPALATSEQFSILRAYLDARHHSGGMAEMTVLDYSTMVEETRVDTMIVEYWLREQSGHERLVATALTDRLADGISMVYSFFDPDDAKRSLGQYMILDHIALAHELGLNHVYLGYWVKGSQKMEYKGNFHPMEKLTAKGWVAMKNDKIEADK